MITISYLAKKHIIKLLSKQKNGTNVRIIVNLPGTIHAECGMEYCDMTDIDHVHDKEFFFEKFNVYIHKSILPFLKDVHIDLLINDFGKQITLKAPYLTSYKKFQNFSQLEIMVKEFLLTEINPQLLLHGGSVKLVEINHFGVAILQFLGGCNGCSMIDMTLKNGIEKKLMKRFPAITGVNDITNHIFGKHSYY